MVAVSLRDSPSEDLAYSVITSVKEASLPDVSGCVRSNLFISGWKVQKTDEGIAISYITQIDLAGSIPTAFLKSTQQQIPLCAGMVSKFVKENGFPPFQTECSAQVLDEAFVFAKREYSTKLDGQGDVKFSISKKMYPGGIKVTITGTGGHEIQGDTLIVTGVNGPTTIKINKA